MFQAERRTKQNRTAAFVRSNRFSLCGAFLFAVLIPELLHPHVALEIDWAKLVHPWDPGLYASIFALVMAHVILRQVSALPLIDKKALVLPAMLASFGVAVGFLSATLGTFSYYHLLTSLILGSAWHYVVIMLSARVGTIRIGIVGDISVDRALFGKRIEWVHMLEPRIPRGIHAIAYDSQAHHSADWERFFSRAVLRRIHVYDIGQLREMLTGRVQLNERPELVFGQLFPSQPYLRVKWVIDILLAIPALIIISPIMALAALLIRLESPGAVIFRQKRVGYQGRIFTCYKLRSMRTDIAGPLYTDEKDPRITRVGQFIRKYRVDELPQIFNILKGEMSWIGPRPEALRLARGYERAIPFYAYRHAVRPGITGWAAVHQGNVALTDAASEKLEYDFFYLKYFSVWLDALIVLMTIRTVLTGFGSR